ncbi:MAG: transcriptional repressor [Syntrophobacteraceae bacterium]|nr:transcriptional repressor [Syntrophobacteraceae bacterium]
MEGQNERDFIAMLRSHGLQVTYQRLAIYQALYDNKDHPSAEVIYQQVRKRFPMISLGTVYKTLERFHEVGLVQKVSPVTEVARYDANVDSHHHMVCLKCQNIIDLEITGASQKISLPEDHGFHVLRHQILIQGYCSNCHNDKE